MTTLIAEQVRKTQHYSTDQQVKYLHLEAEIDMLLQKLTSLSQLKQPETEAEATNTKQSLA